jgi:hypothetical protein
MTTEFETKNYKHQENIMRALKDLGIGFTHFRAKAHELINEDYYIYERKGVFYVRETETCSHKNDDLVENAILNARKF